MKESIKKIKSLLDEEHRKKIPLVMALMFLGAVLETLSVSMLVPLLSVIMDSGKAKNNASDQALFYLIAGIFVLKNIFLYYQISYQAKFANNVRQTIQIKLYEDCLKKPYEFYLRTNTGDILRNIYVDSMGVYNSLLSILNVLMEGAISAALVVAVLAINPFISLVCVGMISVMALVIYFWIKPKMQDIGKTYSNLSGKMNQWILQSTDNIKEIKVMQRETFFVDTFKDQSKAYNDASRRNQVISNAPRLMIEAGTISGVIIMLGISYAGGARLGNIIPQLSAFAVAAMRLLPSVNRLNTALNAVLFNQASVDHVKEALDYIDHEHEQAFLETKYTKTLTQLKNGISIRNVSYAYPDSDKNVFTDINLEIKKGETIGLIGESGSGKTTFVNLILGLLDRVKGDIFWDDERITDDGCKCHMNIGYIPQQISLLDDTIEANVVFGSAIADRARVRNAIEQAKLGEFVESLPNKLDTQVGDKGVRLSGGQRQRIGIARALYMEPDFLALDEATSALDNNTEKELMESIHSLRGKKTMIIIAHRLSTLEQCDRIYKMADGELKLQ